jgi:hypothetical protein
MVDRAVVPGFDQKKLGNAVRWLGKRKEYIEKVIF